MRQSLRPFQAKRLKALKRTPESLMDDSFIRSQASLVQSARSRQEEADASGTARNKVCFTGKRLVNVFRPLTQKLRVSKRAGRG
jgi:hypothetical protein